MQPIPGDRSSVGEGKTEQIQTKTRTAFLRPGFINTGGVRRTVLYPLKAEVSCSLAGKTTPVAFGKYAIFRIFHIEFQALSVRFSRRT